MRKKRTKLGLALALVYLLLLEGYTLVNDEPNDTISEVMSEWGYEYPVIVVGSWLLLAGHWWWRLGGKQKQETNYLVTNCCHDCIDIRRGGIICRDIRCRCHSNNPKEYGSVPG